MIRAFLAQLAGAFLIVGVAAAWLISTPPVHAAERCGDASWYGNEHHGRKTASGSTFNQWAMTAAMPSRKHLGERYRVTYQGKSVVVKITDTGSFAKYNRIIDLSRGAFAQLAPTGQGVLRGVCLTRL